jgi:hypothetical protein
VGWVTCCSAPAGRRGMMGNAGHPGSWRNEQHPLWTIAIQAAPADGRAGVRVTDVHVQVETDCSGNRKERRAGGDHIRVSHEGLFVGQPTGESTRKEMPIHIVANHDETNP